MTKNREKIKKEPAINQTGYRALNVLKYLMQREMSGEELLNKINKEPYINKISIDTIRLDIKTLKSVGFEIKNYDIDGTKKYKLIFSPLKINITKGQMSALNQIKQAVISLWDWRYIIALYKTLEKISKFVQDRDLANELLNFYYFLKIDFELLKELYRLSEKKAEVTLKYDSPKQGIISIKMRLYEIRHDKNTNKLHLYGKLEGYDYISFLRIDKITGIETISLRPSIEIIEPKIEYFKIKADCDYEIEDGEEIIRKTSKYIKIKKDVVNDFKFVQKMLTLQDDVIEVPKNIKDKIYDELIKIQEVYR